MHFLQGKKTYGVAILGALVVLAHLLGLIPESTTDTLLGLLGISGLATLRAALAKRIAAPPQQEPPP